MIDLFNPYALLIASATDLSRYVRYMLNRGGDL